MDAPAIAQAKALDSKTSTTTKSVEAALPADKTVTAKITQVTPDQAQSNAHKVKLEINNSLLQISAKFNGKPPEPGSSVQIVRSENGQINIKVSSNTTDAKATQGQQNAANTNSANNTQAKQQSTARSLVNNLSTPAPNAGNSGSAQNVILKAPVIINASGNSLSAIEKSLPKGQTLVARVIGQNTTPQSSSVSAANNLTNNTASNSASGSPNPNNPVAQASAKITNAIVNQAVNTSTQSPAAQQSSPAVTQAQVPSSSSGQATQANSAQQSLNNTATITNTNSNTSSGQPQATAPTPASTATIQTQVQTPVTSGQGTSGNPAQQAPATFSQGSATTNSQPATQSATNTSLTTPAQGQTTPTGNITQVSAQPAPQTPAAASNSTTITAQPSPQGQTSPTAPPALQSSHSTTIAASNGITTPPPHLSKTTAPATASATQSQPTPAATPSTAPLPTAQGNTTTVAQGPTQGTVTPAPQAAADTYNLRVITQTNQNSAAASNLTSPNQSTAPAVNTSPNTATASAQTAPSAPLTNTTASAQGSTPTAPSTQSSATPSSVTNTASPQVNTNTSSQTQPQNVAQYTPPPQPASAINQPVTNAPQNAQLSALSTPTAILKVAVAGREISLQAPANLPPLNNVQITRTQGVQANIQWQQPSQVTTPSVAPNAINLSPKQVVLVEQSLRQALPQQIPIAEGINQLVAQTAQIANTPAGVATQVDKVALSIMQMFGVKPGANNSSDTIKRNIQHGGLFTEGKLISQPGPQQGDMKNFLSQLSKLADQLPSEQREMLQNTADRMLARVTTNQLTHVQQQHVKADISNERSFQIDIPVQHNEKLDNVEIEIKQRKHQNEEGDFVSIWSVRMHFDLEERGEVDAEVALNPTDNSISTTFLCSKHSTVQEIEYRMKGFRSQLHNQGFDVQTLHCTQGSQTASANNPISKRIIDIRT